MPNTVAPVAFVAGAPVAFVAGAPVAFVAGATGYTGRAVVAALRGAGCTVHAHVRPDSSSLERWRGEFGALGAKVDTTPWDAAALAERLAELRPGAVFALLGTTRQRGAKDGGTYETVDFGLTAMLLEAVQKADLRPRFVYLSATGVRPGGRPGSYMEVRWRFEQALMRSGVPYTIARPAIITGPDREGSRPMERLGASVGDGLLGLVGALGGRGLEARFRSTTAGRLGAALSRLAFDPAAANTIAEGGVLR